MDDKLNDTSQEKAIQLEEENTNNHEEWRPLHMHEVVAVAMVS